MSCAICDQKKSCMGCAERDDAPKYKSLGDKRLVFKSDEPTVHKTGLCAWCLKEGHTVEDCPKKLRLEISNAEHLCDAAQAAAKQALEEWQVEKARANMMQDILYQALRVDSETVPATCNECGYQSPDFYCTLTHTECPDDAPRCSDCPYSFPRPGVPA